MRTAIIARAASAALLLTAFGASAQALKDPAAVKPACPGTQIRTAAGTCAKVKAPPGNATAAKDLYSSDNATQLEAQGHQAAAAENAQAPAAR